MSAGEDNTILAPVTGSEFFQKIGDKAGQLNSSPAVNGDATKTEGNDDEERIVEQIESLCMNCHENVSSCLQLASNGCCVISSR